MGRKIKKQELPAKSGKNEAECPTYLDCVHLNVLTRTGQTKRRLQAVISFCRPFSRFRLHVLREVEDFLCKWTKLRISFPIFLKGDQPKELPTACSQLIQWLAKMFWGQSENNGFNLYSWNNKYFLSKYHYFYISYIIPCMTKIHLLKQAMEIADKKNTSLLKSIITIFDLITTVPKIEEGV